MYARYQSKNIITVFAIGVAAFLAIGIAWAYVAIEAMRARWGFAATASLCHSDFLWSSHFEAVFVSNLLRQWRRLGRTDH